MNLRMMKILAIIVNLHHYLKISIFLSRQCSLDNATVILKTESVLYVCLYFDFIILLFPSCKFTYNKLWLFIFLFFHNKLTQSKGFLASFIVFSKKMCGAIEVQQQKNHPTKMRGKEIL